MLIWKYFCPGLCIMSNSKELINSVCLLCPTLLVCTAYLTLWSLTMFSVNNDITGHTIVAVNSL